jgi:hypothetical protein
MDDFRFSGRCRPVLLALAILAGPLTSSGLAGKLTLKAALESISIQELKNHVNFLASDALEGREAGTTGAWAASKYIIGELEKSEGLRPGDGGPGDDTTDWLQFFKGNLRNILVSIPGSDPDLKDEFILIGAHYDHVGYGSRSNSRGPIGFVHNGADDNASGTAALMEVLEALATVEPAPRRSILAVFWDGEEKGLLGSEFFIQNPTIPLERIRLTLNSDMVGRLGAKGLGLHGSRTAFGLRQFLARENTVGLTLNFSWDYKRDSDHWPFFERNIPAVMLHTGKHNDYHRPSDDVEKVSFEGTQLISQYLVQLTLAACNSDELPQFRPESRPEISSLRSLEQRYSRPIKRPSRFGVSYNSHLAGKDKRILVTRVETGSPANEARLRPDDEILELGGYVVSDVPDFQVLVLTTPSPTTVRFKRDGEELTAKVKLRGDPVQYGFEWRLDEVEPDTVIVTAVLPGSPADLAGIKKDHRILKVGDAVPGSRDEFRKALSEAKGELRFEVELAGRFNVLKVQKFPPD